MSPTHASVPPLDAAFSRRDGHLHVENIPLAVLAEDYGTPLYVYSRAALESAWRRFDDAFGSRPHAVCYSVKCNSNLAVLDVLARLGAGFDIVSAGELERVLRAGGRAKDVVFAGVGKQPHELDAALAAGVRSINIESRAELEAVTASARRTGTRAPVGLRVNPDIDAKTHPYISTGLAENKFGVYIDSAAELLVEAARRPELDVCGLDCHIGSQLTDARPLGDAAARVVALHDALRERGLPIRHLNFGGGFGVRYRDESPLDPSQAVAALLEAVGDRDVDIVVEPGRSIAANAGVMLTRAIYVKHNGAKRFVVVDAAMNDLIRPPLYDAWHEIVCVDDSGAESAAEPCDIVGPVCESADFLGRDRALHAKAGELLAVCSAGAYSFVMSSNYNTRPRAAEVLVDGDRAHLARRRESLDDLLALEHTLDSVPEGA